MAMLRRHGVVCVATLMVCVALAGQVVTSSMMPGLTGRDTAESVADASFAYLTSIRTYLAALLWNRFDPLTHEFYEGATLKDMRYAMPSMALITMLNPQFERAYYIGAWILARNDRVPEAIDLARAGLENNPHSGLMRVSCAQVLWVFGTDADKPEALTLAEAALGPDTEWRDPIQQHDNYAVLLFIYTSAGNDERVAFLESEIERLDAEIGDALPAGSHDHDGDGVPDH